ncbi:HD domain-containing protein [Streptomyces physcomitrii]|uniref:HD domain-containing protein n=1 Tax=Streptomyces physcomitrii TaxID=2724184 RepID=UPI001FE297AE|nr:caspase family protein [Streptomyces physcomitrii]
MGPDTEGARDGARRALLLGVRRTTYLDQVPELAERFPPLDFAARDVTLLHTALEQSGYTVTVKHEDTGRGPVVGCISDFFASCEAGDTAFLYISCHGETLAGRDHLVLADSQPGRPRDDGTRGLHPHTLLRAAPAELLGSLPAGVTAVVCLDICRVAEQSDPDVDQGAWQSGRQDAYWIYSCGAGQRSYADPTEGSWFAQALVKALSPSTRPTTLHEVVQYAGTELRRIADRHPEVEPPGIETVLPLPGQDAQHGDPLLCEGSRQTLAWAETIRHSALWAHTSGAASTHERVREKLAELVHHVAESFSGAGAHQDDPWADPNYPARVETRLGELVARAELRGDDLLSPAETACLLASAVVHEGIVAVALEELRHLQPRQLDPGPRGREEGTGTHDRLVRDAARDVCRAHSLVLRTVETLRGRGLTEATLAADHWLRHRFIADWDRLWERTGDYSAVDKLIERVVQAIEAAADSHSAGPRTPEARREIDSQVRQVLGHLTVKPGLSPRINDPDHGNRWISSRPVRGNQWRGRQLARLLWTAGLLAADPRRLASVLVDHLGAHEPLRAGEVVGALGTGFDYDEASGRRNGPGPEDTGAPYGLAVRFACPHPALHAAVEELALAADATVRAVHADTSAGPLLRGLPHRVTTEQLRALPGRYKEPLERFRLAEDEIRPLLMGTQLYGDRMLAVRELYQNALDACRYREMRHQYGRAQQPVRSAIVLTQGWDKGRQYIECTDTGAGMSRSRLTSMFARAGKRYEQDPEFVLERRNWRRAGIVDRAMNSRFGIGVFSYFMLADEVVVWSQAVDHFGRVAGERAQRADIQSGSGLLQINESDDPLVPADGGTRVRLYLAEPRENEKRPSVVETLRALLWVTEHEVHAVEHDENGVVLRELHWQPGLLKSRDGWHGNPVELTGDAWLVQGEGQLLLDGIVMQDAPKVYGRVVNLRERHSPVPSVDRKQLLSYDETLVLEELLEAVVQAAPGMDEVSLRWLWKLVDDAPRLAVAVLESLPGQAIAVLGSEEGGRLGHDRLRLGNTGCYPSDRLVMRGSLVEFNPGAENSRWEEAALLNSWQCTRLGIRQDSEPFAPEGYAPAQSLDALLYLHDAPRGWASVLETAAKAGISVRTALRAIRRHAIAGVTVPSAEDIRALGDETVDQIDVDLHFAYVDRGEEVRSLRAPQDSYLRRSAEFRRAALPAVHGPMIISAAEHELPLGDLVSRLGRLRNLDRTLPPPPCLSPELAAARVSKDEVAPLVYDTAQFSWRYSKFRFQGLTGQWLPGRVRPVDLLSRAAPPFSVSELARRITQFAPLGLSLAREPASAALEATELVPEQRLLLPIRHTDDPPWREGPLPLAALLVRAAELLAPLGEVARRVNRASPSTGVTAPVIPEAAEDWLVPPWVGSVFSRRSLGEERKPVLPWELVGSYSSMEPKDPSAFSAAVGQLEALGLIDWRGVRREDLETQALRRHQYLRVSADLDEDGVTFFDALALTVMDGTDLGTVMDRIATTDHVLPLRIPTLPSEARKLQATAAEVATLTDEDGPVEVNRFRRRLRIPGLLRHAERTHTPLAATVTRLHEFTVVGAPTPPGELPGPALDKAFGDFHPDRFDKAAFGDGLLGPGLLGPLELVRTAGRFGWTLGKAYARYAPFRLLGLDVRVREPQGAEVDTVPTWRDVILLTEQLTGSAPALSGEVAPDHLVLGAEETEWEEAAVRERLLHYAELFQLKLPPAAEEDAV